MLADKMREHMISYYIDTVKSSYPAYHKLKIKCSDNKIPCTQNVRNNNTIHIIQPTRKMNMNY
uniref:Uncharacterized protein n=1 Tax=Arundo donax TaxID=35708 RepID=A0A0A9FFK8_ARUDO